jgi:hypothetical protein
MRDLCIYGVEITPAEIHGLLLACPHLTKLRIEHCHGLEQLDDVPIGELCPRLEELYIYYNGCCPDDGMLLGLSLHCKYLSVLDITDSTRATTIGLCAVARQCQRLQDVDVSHCIGVDDLFLSVLAMNCLHLRILKLQSCPNITDAGVNMVMEGCPYIAVVNVANCPQVTEQMKLLAERHFRQRAF